MIENNKLKRTEYWADRLLNLLRKSEAFWINARFEKIKLDLVLPLLAYVIMIILVRPFGDFPLNDDWVYIKDVMKLHDTGNYSITGFESAWALPQVLLGALISNIFGFSIVYVRFQNIIATVCIIFSLYLLLRQITSSSVKRLFLLLSFSLYAPLLLLSFSFMTDILFLFFWVLSCLLFELYFSKKQPIYLHFAFIFAILATIQRQVGLALLISTILMVMFYLPVSFSMSKKDLKRYFFWVFLHILFFVAINKWWLTLGQINPPLLPTLVTNRLLYYLNPQYFIILYMALCFIPFLGLLFPDAEKLKSMKIKELPYKTILYIATLIIFVSICWHNGKYMPYLGNQISAFGVFNEREVLNGVRPILLNGYLGIALTILSLLSAILILFPISYFADKLLSLFKLKWPFQTQTLLPPQKYPTGSFTFIAGIIYLLFLTARLEIFDRYIIVLIPATMIPLAASQINVNFKKIIISSVLATCIFILSLAYVHDYFRWNEAKWDATYFALNHNVHYQALEAGYEYNGYFSRTRLSHHSKFPEHYPYVVSYSPIPTFNIIKGFPYKTIFPPYNQSIYLLENMRLKKKIAQ